MPYRVAIVDDSPQDSAFVQQCLTDWAQERQVAVHTERFPSAESFLFRYAEDKGWDILLLDIEMGEMDGVTLAKTIRQNNQGVQIVFITGFADFIGEGYEVSALHYLMKPVRGDKLATVLDRAVTALRAEERFVLLPADGETLRLPVGEIQYAEAFSHTVTLMTEQGEIPLKMSISEAEKRLGEDFVRCHRSYLVGLKHISRLSKSEVLLDSGRALPLSRGAAPTVHKAFISYYTGGQHEAH